MNKKLTITYTLMALLSITSSVYATLDRNEPISYAGHGVLYDFYGREVIPNQKLVNDAQAYYLRQLLYQASVDHRLEYNTKKISLDSLDLTDKEQLYANYLLLKWFITLTAPTEPSKYYNRNNLLRDKILASDKTITSNIETIGADLFEPSSALINSLSTIDLSESTIHSSGTQNSSHYRQECKANSVPSPPPWGDYKWKFQKELVSEFMSKGTKSKVYTFESSEPEGLCMALPRITEGTINFLGVICLSKVTGKACFWDNQIGGTTQPFLEGQRQNIPGQKFSGGIDLTSPNAGICTECHVGENPFIIHPDTKLGLPNLAGLDLFANIWYKPLVNPAWPQNSGPTTLIDNLDKSESCIACHRAGGQGGRFPEISTAIRGYCNNVLRKAVGNCVDGDGAPVTNCKDSNTYSPLETTGIIVPPTMPPSNPGSLANTTHVSALLDACNNIPNPIIRFDEVILDYAEVVRGFSSSKALVIHNDGNATLNITINEGNNPSDLDDANQWSQISLNSTTTQIAPGDPPLIFRQTYTPTNNNTHSIYLSVESNDPSNSTERITLTGSGINPRPIDSMLLLNRSGSMQESAGSRKKIEAMRDAAYLYADLLRDNLEGEMTGDKLGFVKYNNRNSDYMSFGFVNAAKRTEINAKLSDNALTQSSSLNPEGGTGIGSALLRAAKILESSPSNRRQVMVVLVDNYETETPFITNMIEPIKSANNDLIIFSVGLGEHTEPDKLQNISNTGRGYHQITEQLSNINVFDLETFYFNIFAEAADMDLVVHKTHAETIISPNPVIVDTAKIISSDRSATFLVLDDPLMRQFYKLEFLTPNGDVIVPGFTVGGFGIQERSRHNYKIFKIVFPSQEFSSSYTGDWSIRLTPNEDWDPQKIRQAQVKSKIDYSGWLNPSQGTVPIGFAATVSSDYRLDIKILPSSFVPGASVKITANLTDRLWPAPTGSVNVTITDPNRISHSLILYDDGTHGDSKTRDAIWTNAYIQTASPGVYKFLFQSFGHNLQGELSPREASRYLTLQYPAVTPNLKTSSTYYQFVLWILLVLLLFLLTWYYTYWKKRLDNKLITERGIR